MKTYKTITSRYSLEENNVGRPIGEEVITEFSTGKSALLALDFMIDYQQREPQTGYIFLIELPSGERVPFDRAYTEIFGVPPIYRDNKAALYPKLKK